jgi:hypothetical protein
MERLVGRPNSPDFAMLNLVPLPLGLSDLGLLPTTAMLEEHLLVEALGRSVMELLPQGLPMLQHLQERPMRKALTA